MSLSLREGREPARAGSDAPAAINAPAGSDAPAGEGARGTGPADWRVRMRLARSRLIADPRFRHWAARIPGLRRIARGRALALFDMVAGFAYTKTLAASLDTGLLRALDGTALTRAEIGALPGLTAFPAPSTDALLTAAIGLDLIVRVADRYALGDAGASVLAEPGIPAMSAHHALTYRDLDDPVALLGVASGASGKSGRAETARFWEYAGGREDGTTPEGAARYSELMGVTQTFVAREIVAAYPFPRHRHLIDIGGGSGAFAEAVAQGAPGLRVTVFDLPDVASLARRRFEEAGLAPRCDAVGGSFHADDLPADGDLYSLVRVLYDHDDAPAQDLLRRLHDAMPEGATLIVAEPMARLGGHERVGAYFAMYLAAMQSGRCREPGEIMAMLREAGFRDARERPVASPLFTGLVVARR